MEFGRKDAIEKLDLYHGDKVLEIGVGTGLSFDYYPEGTKIVGFDYSEGMLNQSKEKAENNSLLDVDLLQMDAQSMSFSDKTFDKILAAYVMTVVPDVEKAVKELIRVAKPGAKVVLINHLRSQNRFLSWFEDVFHPLFSSVGLFSLDEDLFAILTSCGIKEIEITPTSIFRLHYIISFTTPF